MTLRKTVCAVLVGSAAIACVGTAFAGDGINAVFNIGVANTVSAASVLRGGTAAEQLRVANTAAGGATGVSGVHSAAAGSAAGAEGDTQSTAENATGVFGKVTAANAPGSSAAVQGINSGAGAGVFGRNPNNVPSGYGIVGEGRYGLVGRALFDGASSGLWASSPNGFAGVEGHSANPNGFGVYGRNTTSGPALYGTSSGGYGVWGNGTYGLVGGGTAGGVWATTGNPAASGVFGQNTDAGRGVFGWSSTGTGVYGLTTSLGTTAPAVEGDSDSVSSGAAGVVGKLTSNQTGGSSAGVRGINNGTTNGAGVWGEHAGSGWGVLGTSPSGLGVYGRSDQGYAFRAEGDASQAFSRGGWLKGALYYDPGRIDHVQQCYNGQLTPDKATYDNCGFTASGSGLGFADIDFGAGFNVSGRFILITPVASGGDVGATLNELPGGRVVRVRTFYRSKTCCGNVAQLTNAPFFVLVF
jgi:hypothetical protein